MKVSELDRTVIGRRIVVTKIAIGDAERAGHVEDSKRLAGQEGVATDLSLSYGGKPLQLWVEWDDPYIGLALVAEDEIEIRSDRPTRVP